MGLCILLLSKDIFFSYPSIRQLKIAQAESESVYEFDFLDFTVIATTKDVSLTHCSPQTTCLYCRLNMSRYTDFIQDLGLHPEEDATFIIQTSNSNLIFILHL